MTSSRSRNTGGIGDTSFAVVMNSTSDRSNATSTTNASRNRGCCSGSSTSSSTTTRGAANLVELVEHEHRVLAASSRSPPRRSTAYGPDRSRRRCRPRRSPDTPGRPRKRCGSRARRLSPRSRRPPAHPARPSRCAPDSPASSKTALVSLDLVGRSQPTSTRMPCCASIAGPGAGAVCSVTARSTSARPGRDRQQLARRRRSLSGGDGESFGDKTDLRHGLLT